MNCFILVMVFHASILLADTETASKGAITEALFIIENKQRDVQDFIQVLKKDLTLCFLKNGEHLQGEEKQLEEYHCKVKRVVYPRYIDELESLLKKIASDSTQLAKEEPITPAFLKSSVDYAFLLRDKIESESHMLTVLFALDAQECDLTCKRRALKRKQQRIFALSRELKAEKKVRSLKKQVQQLRRSRSSLEKSIRTHKKELQALKRKLEPLNKALYDQSLDQERLHIDKLAPFK